MAVEKEILLRVEVDRSESQKELEAVTKQLLENKQAVKELGDAYKQGLVSTDKYVKETISLKKAQTNLSAQQKTLTKELAVEANSLEALRLKLAAVTKERNQTNQRYQ
jgi:chromosome segregation ATPase